MSASPPVSPPSTLPAISVVITCYNLEPYIGEAIDSALAALRGMDGEVVVVDDCSTDGSEVEIQKRDVRFVRTPRNSGVMQATLLGIRETRHDLVAFLDGDDVWHQDKLARVAATFRADPSTAFVTHDLDFIDARGRALARRSRPSQTMGLDPETWSAHLRRSILEHRDDVWLGSAMTVHRERARLAEFAAWVAARSDADDLYQDWPMAAWIASLRDVRLGYVPAQLFSYRLHGANHSGDAVRAERALRNFRRSRNTLSAMADIATDRGELTPKLDRDLALAESQVAQYEGRPSAAVRSFAKAVPGLAIQPRLLAKEALRLSALSLLGPESGHKLLKRLAR